MRAIELRIGNLIKVKTSNDAGIYSIDGIGNYVSVGNDEFKNPIFERKVMITGGARDGEKFIESKLKPIPLTEEWLLKLGFHVCPEFYWIGWLKIRQCFDEDKGYEMPEYNDKHISIKYVHQLQNLYFALSGKELTTK